MAVNDIVSNDISSFLFRLSKKNGFFMLGVGFVNQSIFGDRNISF